MESSHLYKNIAETIRRQILEGRLKPGDRLPPVREMASQWNCTTGTIQRAYQELSRQGLIVSRPGRGTRIVDNPSPSLISEAPLRKASLIHRAEAYLLDMLTAGYSLPEIEDALLQAMDRWRSLDQKPKPAVQNILRFSGSHDLVIAWLASHFPEITPDHRLNLEFSGSLGGLIALAENRADIAGSHLWDEETDTYNTPFVRRILPGRRIALVTMAKRRLGLILQAGNPKNIHRLEDISKTGVRFINRQPGSGTRVWLDIALSKLGLESSQIQGYDIERSTHSAIARAIAEGEADVGIGLEAAANSFGLDFVFLRYDRYDLVIPETLLSMPAVSAILNWLNKADTRSFISSLGGYISDETGRIQWVE